MHFLQRAGHDVVHVRDLGSKGRTDGYHLYTAARDRRIMVVYNGDDYFLLHDALYRWIPSPAESERTIDSTAIHAGILHFQQRQGLTVPQLSQAISEFVASGYPTQNRFYTYDIRTSWVERPFLL